MKKLHLLTAVILSACALAGCGNSEDTPAIQTIESQTVETAASEVTSEASGEVSEESGEVAEEAVITERYEKDGMMQSYLTGEWKDADVVNRRSMAVMVGNNSALLPQYGISQASIIYEAPVEGRISRLMLFIEDYDDLERVGPVRSSREYFV